MGLINGYAGELALTVDGLEMLAKRFGESILRGYVEEAGLRVA